MLNVEIKFGMQEKEMSLDSFVEVIVREVRVSLREEIGRILKSQANKSLEPSKAANSEVPRLAVSIRRVSTTLRQVLTEFSEFFM